MILHQFKGFYFHLPTGIYPIFFLSENGTYGLSNFQSFQYKKLNFMSETSHHKEYLISVLNEYLLPLSLTTNFRKIKHNLLLLIIRYDVTC